MDVQWCPAALLMAVLHLQEELDQLYLGFSILNGEAYRYKLNSGTL